MNKENFSSWKNMMRLHLSKIGDNAIHWLKNAHGVPTYPKTMEEMV